VWQHLHTPPAETCATATPAWLLLLLQLLLLL
jgi:hypothetical protein